MTFLPGAKESEFKTLDNDVYEAVITDLEHVDNSFYKPGEDPDYKAKQFKWYAKVRGVSGQEDVKGTSLSFFTSANLSLDSRAKLPKLLDLLDDDFDVKVGYDSLESMKAAVIGKPIRLSTEQKPVEKDGQTKVYNKVKDWMASKAGALSVAENLELVQGATIVADEDIPF